MIAFGRSVVITHPRTEPKFNGFGSGFSNDFLEESDFYFRCIAAIAAGAIDRNFSPQDFTKQFSEWFVCNFAKQVKNRNFEAGNAHPERQALPFII